MNTFPRKRSLGCLSGTLFAFALTLGSSGAAVLFTEDFNGISAAPGNFNGSPSGQVTTTHDLVFGAGLTGWSGSGAGAIHAVDTANT